MEGPLLYCVLTRGDDKDMSSCFMVMIFSNYQLILSLHLEIILRKKKSLLFLHADWPSEVFNKLEKHHWNLFIIYCLVFIPHLLIRRTITGQVLPQHIITFITSSVPFLTGNSVKLPWLYILILLRSTLQCMVSSDYLNLTSKEVRGEKIRLALTYYHLTS